MNISTLYLPLTTLGLIGLLSGCTEQAADTASAPTPPGQADGDGTDDESGSDGTSPGDTGVGDTDGPDTDAPVSGAYSGDLVITMYTDYGDDTCTGTAGMDIEDGTSLTGSGSCSFSLLGSQAPSFVGDLTEDGQATGWVDLEVFGAGFSLDWSGTWSESEIVSDYSATTNIDSIGSVDYIVSFELIAEEPDDPDETDPTEGLTDYTSFGSFAYGSVDGTHTTTDGCSSDYTLFTPSGEGEDVLVVIQHGFTRSAENFMSWGEHLASWNIPTLVLSLCHSSAWDINIDQNGEDAYEVARSITSGPVLYIGHSNGAISSLVSASLDDNPVAVLGLDPVERIGGDHTDDAAMLNVPVRSLLGESGACNSWNSGLSAYQSASNSEVLQVTEADHCDFEAPTDTICTLACGGSNTLFDDGDIQSTIIGLSTSFVLWQVLDEDDAREWWDSNGAMRSALESDGAITNL